MWWGDWALGVGVRIYKGVRVTILQGVNLGDRSGLSLSNLQGWGDPPNGREKIEHGEPQS